MQRKLKELEGEGLSRQLIPVAHKGTVLEHGGREYLNLSSNDYLGISANADLQSEFLASLDGSGFVMGALSSRLLTGNSPCIEEFEGYVAGLYGNACLSYNSGYHANVGILPALVSRGDLVVADRLAHASLVDGIRLCRCEFKRFRHNDCEALEQILRHAAGKYGQVYIVTESVFSMDGDTACLERIVELKERYGARLYLDEAHAFGVVGDSGLGCARDRGLAGRVDYLVCTLGKAAASEGAFLICDAATKQWLVNASRTLIYTTAAPPINVLWTHFVVRKITEMNAERQHLKRLTARLRSLLKDFRILGDSHIVPLVTGENEACLRLSEQMRQRGVWAMPVRYPSVPRGEARIRLSLSAAMTEQQIDKVYESILA
jgi:8-amino-7-oxononanoate synthase